MTPPSRLSFVPDLASVPAPRHGASVVVLDPAWTPGPDARDDLVTLRPLIADVVSRIDAFDDALELLDRWADATGIADRLLVEGVTYWFRMRETMWRWLHERLLWAEILAEFVPGDTDLVPAVGAVEVSADEVALADVARARWGDRVTVLGGADPPPSSPDGPAAARAIHPVGVLARLRRALRAHGRGRAGTSARPERSPEVAERARREALLDARVRALVASSRPRVLVLTNPATHQRVARGGGRRRDPLFGAVIDRLRERGVEPILIGTGLDQRRDDDWALVADDDHLLPQFLLRTRWSEPIDDARADRAVEGIERAVAEIRGTPLEVAGIDLEAPFLDALAASAAGIVRADVHTLARVERLLAELRPGAIVLAQEGIRTPWLVAGRAAGIPVFAVQHGVLYEGHAGYPPRRHEAICRPTRTFVYGEFERGVLVGRGAYEPDEVEVSGSPRLDLDATASSPEGATVDNDPDRQTVRDDLGVAPNDRMLVVSTVNLRFVQRTHFANMIARVLGGPLPGVHLVFKLHPGEHDEGPYRAMLEGMAAAAGHEPPPITIVKDIDLYRLLRAADAHLGMLSTVLTDAVAVGTPNLIAMVDRHVDLLGYVEAGVARPVHGPADLLAEMRQPTAPDPAARAAFLARHFRPGAASERIAAAVHASIGGVS